MQLIATRHYDDFNPATGEAFLIIGEALGFVAKLENCVPCPRTVFTRVRQHWRCSRWPRPLLIPGWLRGLLRPPPI
jgi:hypothetical protein